MNKMIELKMPDGSVWYIPLRFVAENRAKYYSECDGGTGDEIAANFKEEVEYGMEDDLEAQDWLQNNMNWSDVEHVARRIEQPPASQKQYQKWFVNAPTKVVEIERISWSEYWADDEHATLTISFDDVDKYPAILDIDADGFILTEDNLPGIIKTLQTAQEYLKRLNNRSQSE